MPAPHGHEPTDKAVLARMTSSEREHLGTLAAMDKTSVNQSIRNLIQTSMDQTVDPLGELELSPQHRAYVESHAREHRLTPVQAITDMIEHCVQHDRYDRIMAERQAASQAPTAPERPERPKHPGGTRKQREKAARDREKTTPAPTSHRTGGGFPTSVPAGFRAPKPPTT